MQIIDNRVEYAGNLVVGDVVIAKAKNETETYSYLLTSNMDLESRKVGTTSYFLIRLATGSMYYRDFSSLVHVKNHLNKHFSSFEVIPKDRIKLVIE
jgi:hypothetical protein